jgi:hypothetical protein
MLHHDWVFMSIEHQLPTYPSIQPLATTILLPASMGLTSLDTSYKWNHSVVTLLWLACFPQNGALWVHLCSHIWQDFLFKAEYYSSVCITIFSLSFVHQWTFRLLPHIRWLIIYVLLFYYLLVLWKNDQKTMKVGFLILFLILTVLGFHHKE